MKRWLTRWKSIPLRQRVMIGVAVLMIVLVAGKYGSGVTFSLPLPATIADEYHETKVLAERLTRARRREVRRALARQALRRQASSLVWEMNGGNPSTEVQAALERIARTAQVTIRTMGRPRTADVSDTIRTIELSLNMRGTMREIGRFLIEVQNFPQRFEWTVCTIRPTNPRDPSSVMLTGSVTAYYLSSAAETAVFKSREEKP